MNKIQFTWHGKSYAMTADEIEAAYRHQLHAYRMQDAERHVNNLVFDEDEHDPDSEYQKQAIDEFNNNHGCTYADLMDSLECIVERFEDDFDCNVDENTQWQNAIKTVISEMTGNED